MAITSNQNNNTVFGAHRNDVKVYTDLDSSIVMFTGDRVRVSSRPVGTLLALEGSKSTTSRPRVAIQRTDITKENGDPWYIFSNRPAWFFFDRDGNRVTSGTDAAAQVEQLVTYLNRQFSGEFVDLANFEVDDTGSLITVYSGSTSIGHHSVNSILACAEGTTIKVISKGNLDEVVYDGLLVSTTKLNGVSVNGVLNNAINELNGAFTQTSSFLNSAGNPVVSGVVTGDDLTLTLNDSTAVTIDVTTLNVDTDNSVSSGAISGTDLVLTMSDASTVTVDIQTLVIGSNPTYPAANWYVAFGSAEDTLLTNNKCNNTFKNHAPFYYGDTLEKGKEMVWSYDGDGTMSIGIWDGATNVATGTGSYEASNWSMRFSIEGDSAGGGSMLVRNSTQESDTNNTVGTDIDTRYPDGYQLSITDTLAIRYMQNDKLGLFDLTDGSSILIAESNDTYSGAVTFHGQGQSVAVQTTMPFFTKREDVFEFAHHGLDDTDWRDGTNRQTVLKTIATFGPGQKMRWNVPFAGENRRWGLGYTGTLTDQVSPEDYMPDSFRYGTSENFYSMPDWTLNSSASGYKSTGNGDSFTGYHIANGTPIGEVEIRYVDANTIELWSVVNNEKIADLNRDPLGTDQRVFMGSHGTGALTVANIPIISRMEINPSTSTSNHNPDMTDQDLNTTEGANVYYVIQKDTGSDIVTMYGSEDLPSWLVLNQSTGVIMGTAPAWTGTPGSGTTNDTVVLIKSANPFGITNFNLNVRVGEDAQSTNWTKAYQFDSTQDNLSQSGSSAQNCPIRHTIGTSQPWAVASVFKYEQEASTNTIWAQAINGTQSNPHVWLRILATDKLVFRHGSNGSGLAFNSTDDVSITDWTGIIVTYDGAALDSTTLTNAGETGADHFTIQSVDLSTGAVSDIAGTWTMYGTGSDSAVDGDFSVGSLYSTGHVFKGDIAMVSVTTNTVGYAMQNAEKAEMVRDPSGWLATYRDGAGWRVPGQSSTSTNWQVDHTDELVGSQATKVFLMGDGTNDSFPYIYDQTCNTVNTQRMVANNMISTQVVNVTVPGLS